ncbi:hypothetical protein CANCADRAFT_85722 [Tortispora caseinolytica NRRL Y-17796]|uniref:HMG box domain-containing protein n=1 Tax=Tortispora caseinolytica NRRL Y-17796 TaxID=767744 RepID=A0A1E4TKT5_9ASCO|nr:hypothetical protein CANCADRAFT_85722 [Tortispora caseinolytica NRRL Y-17796]
MAEQKDKSSQKDGISALAPESVNSRRLSGSEEKYRLKCKALKRRIKDICSNNDALLVRIRRTEKAILRMRLERALLMQKMEMTTLLPAEDSESEKDLDDSALYSVPQSEFAKIEALLPANGTEMSPASTGAAAEPGSTGKKAKKAKTAKDDISNIRIRKTISAYQLFCDHEKERIRADIESGRIPGKGDYHALKRAMGEAWRSLDPEQRAHWQKKSEQAKNEFISQYLKNAGVEQAEKPGDVDEDDDEDDTDGSTQSDTEHTEKNTTSKSNTNNESLDVKNESTDEADTSLTPTDEPLNNSNNSDNVDTDQEMKDVSETA